MAYTGVQDQLEVLAWVTDNSAAVAAGKTVLAFADESTRSPVAKVCGCTASQVSMWARGAWSPPTVQRLQLLKAAAEVGSRVSGRAVAS